LAEFERMLVMEDAEVSAATQPVQWAWVVGPKGAEIQWGSQTRWGSADVFGLGGWVAVGPAAQLQTSLAGLPTLDDDAWTTLRLERGVVEWAREFDGAERPHEAGLERRAVDWQKGCYLGQEVVCMQDMRGKVSRRVERLRLDGLAADPSPVGMSVHAKGDAKVLGTVATAAFSRRAAAWLGFAMLPVPLPDGGVVIGAADATRGGQRVETLY
jgi:folate-binding protein YgfZ